MTDDWATRRRKRRQQTECWVWFLIVGGLLIWLSGLTSCGTTREDRALRQDSAQVVAKLEVGACSVCADPAYVVEDVEAGKAPPPDPWCGHPRGLRMVVSVNAPIGGERTDRRDSGTPEWLLWLVLGGLALAAAVWAWRAGLLDQWLGPGAREGAPSAAGTPPLADRTGLDEADGSG